MIQCSWHLFMLIGLSIASPVIHTRLGVIKGSLKTSYYGKQFYAFEGIPYAKPPIGNLRFKPPVPIESWNGVWEATKLYECIQSSVIPLPNRTGLTGEEDCLYVNVYTPEFQRGGFYAGSGHSYTKPTYLLDRNMIFVSFNYRLGPLGFLSTGNNLIPGNLGLKDQVLALKWVEENIEYFHGNKNSITLSGFSSGAASAEFHLFSPLSKGLFQRAILHSGSALALWATLPNPLEKATLLANTVGCLNTSLKYMVECLKERPAALLVEKATAIRFAPVVEPEGSESFLTETPRNLIESGKVLDVPILVSYTSEEGLFFCNSSEYEVEDGFKEIFVKKFPGVAGIYDRIEDYYLKEETDISEGRLKLVTDAIIRIPLQESILLHSALGNSDVYCYVFNYVPQTSFMDLLIENVPHTGSSHGDDINLLYASTDLRKLAEEDEKISGFLLDALTSFSKDGVPKISNQQWKPANGINHLSCLEFNSKTNIALRNQNTTALQFWKSQKLIV